MIDERTNAVFTVILPSLEEKIRQYNITIGQRTEESFDIYS